MKKLGKILSFLTLIPLGISPFLCSCKEQKPKPKPIPDEFKASIDDQNRLGFSYNNAPTDHVVDYPINFEGTIHTDDYLELSIFDQKLDGKTGDYIELLSNSIWFPINPETKSFTIQTRKNPYFEDKIFLVNFSIEICVWREEDIIAKIDVENLYFCNATPTIESMFATHDDEEGKKVLDGFVSEPWVQDQLQYCNMFLLPKNILSIKDHAFYDEELQTSLLPENIRILMLDSSLKILSEKGKLESVGQKAFYGSKFTQIWLPQSLINVDFYAFSGNDSISLVDLSPFTSIPDWEGHLIFYDGEIQIPDSGTVYLNSSAIKFEWQSWIRELDGSDTPMSDWTWENL